MVFSRISSFLKELVKALFDTPLIYKEDKL